MYTKDHSSHHSLSVQTKSSDFVSKKFNKIARCNDIDLRIMIMHRISSKSRRITICTSLQADLELAAMEAIMECNLFAIKAVLHALKKEWRGPVPVGLQILASAKKLPFQSNTAAPQGRQAELGQLTSMPTLQAVQVR